MAGDVRFAVEERFKGVTSDEITIKVYSGFGMCRYSVQVGTRYVVFASKSEKGEIGIGLCSPVTRLEGSREQLELLRHLPPPGIFAQEKNSTSPRQKGPALGGTVPGMEATIGI